MRMICGLALAIAMLALATAARADEASDYMAAAGDEVKALGTCTGTYARSADKSLTPEAIADAAFKECDSKAGAVTIALQHGPTHLSEDKAQEVTREVIAGSRAHLIDLIKKSRE